VASAQRGSVPAGAQRRCLSLLGLAAIHRPGRGDASVAAVLAARTLALSEARAGQPGATGAARLPLMRQRWLQARDHRPHPPWTARCPCRSGRAARLADAAGPPPPGDPAGRPLRWPRCPPWRRPSGRRGIGQDVHTPAHEVRRRTVDHPEPRRWPWPSQLGVVQFRVHQASFPDRSNLMSAGQCGRGSGSKVKACPRVVRTRERSRRSVVAISLISSRSATAATHASVVPNGRSPYFRTSSAALR
jgi:hypothetical protein